MGCLSCSLFVFSLSVGAGWGFLGAMLDVRWEWLVRFGRFFDAELAKDRRGQRSCFLGGAFRFVNSGAAGSGCWLVLSCGCVHRLNF